jgi:signal transduction histidine kinase/CHASE2 domain-containing sensor protein
MISGNSFRLKPGLPRFSFVTLAFAALFIGLYATGVTRPLDNLFLDVFFRLRPQALAPQDIVIVKLDQAFVEAYPFRIGELDRGFYAKVLDNLHQAGANVIGLDLFFPERSRTGVTQSRDPDTLLAEAIARNNVVLPLVPDSQGNFLPTHPWLKDAQQGVIALEESAHQLRPQILWQGQVLPSFALAIVQAANRQARIDITQSQLIDFRGKEGRFLSLSFLDIYRNQFSYSMVKDKIVLVGVTLKGTDRDQILTPFGEMSGVEVNANQVYTLLHGNLVTIPTTLYSLLLLCVGLIIPSLVKRMRGLLYAVVVCAGIFIMAYFMFRLGVFMTPVWLGLLPLIAYGQSSYRHLLQLDNQISSSLLHLLDNAVSSGQQDVTQNSLAKGFAPKGYVVYAPDMLESLIAGLNASAGLLMLDRVQHQQGEIDDTLLQLLQDSVTKGTRQQKGTLPHYLAEPIFLDGHMIGSVALILNSPPPPHLLNLLQTSLQTFGQLARYQKLRDHTSTLTGTLWPWRSRSSIDKLDALSIVSDLLATERGWLGALVETLPQAVFIMSPYGYNIYRNDAARRLFSDEKNMLAALPESLKIEAERFRQDYAMLVERGEELELGLTERATGRPVLLTLRVIKNGEEIKGVAGVISNLSKIEELDRQRQELIGMVVHDLRSPLTSIQGFAEVMLGGNTSNEYLHIIKSEADRMRRMTDIFLDVVRLESEQFKLYLGHHNFAELLRYAVASVSSQAAEKNIILVVKATTYVAIQADADLLSRMMVNLLSNAIKYSSEGKRITLSLSEGETTVLLEIQDQGYGMSDEQQKTLFQKYQRSDNEKSRRLIGTGLGLYVVKLITDLHHGEILVRSHIDQGTTFAITLPTTQVYNEQTQELELKN